MIADYSEASVRWTSECHWSSLVSYEPRTRANSSQFSLFCQTPNHPRTCRSSSSAPTCPGRHDEPWTAAYVSEGHEWRGLCFRSAAMRFVPWWPGPVGRRAPSSCVLGSALGLVEAPRARLALQVVFERWRSNVGDNRCLLDFSEKVEKNRWRIYRYYCSVLRVRAVDDK